MQRMEISSVVRFVRAANPDQIELAHSDIRLFRIISLWLWLWFNFGWNHL